MNRNAKLISRRLAALACATWLSGCACFPAGNARDSYAAPAERAARQIECRYDDGQESGAGGAAMWRQIRRP